MTNDRTRRRLRREGVAYAPGKAPQNQPVGKVDPKTGKGARTLDGRVIK